jgi:hypothetical protein
VRHEDTSGREFSSQDKKLQNFTMKYGEEAYIKNSSKQKGIWVLGEFKLVL